ncbi:transcription initiation factor IID, TAF10 subunit [Rhizopogon vinicolor AM-OR11-026]|uniref:Transcription initiation factor TFIID subunit 10 n=1 Tax=Rhizopogon vinicolor AM-OR11-026 TaxID=1314800 RepID=A0A1B7N4L9_9AGAM|nr:transcription initiation factor IID, TAF10 subunit [Rhizopogon vinicolor AM-OR11-026]
MSTPGAFADSPTSQSSPYSYYPPGNLPDVSQQQQLSQAATVAASSSTASSTAVASQPQSRQAAEEARKDRTLAEFLVMLDEYEPLIPNEVTDYYLQRVGFECEDVRLKRLLSLAAQKFVSDIAADAYQHARIRTNAVGGRARGPLAGPGSAKDKTRTTLTMDDLSAALAEYGINARKPEFYL